LALCVSKRDHRDKPGDDDCGCVALGPRFRGDERRPYDSAALDAYRRYGKGVHPKARLNLGDCAAYALAKSLNAPLPFKGSDFAETDVAMRA
jgi:hypothetical protein